MALDLDSINKNKKSVIKFSEKKEKTLAPFENISAVEIGKKTIPDSRLEQEYKRLEKIELRTQQLLSKAEGKSKRLSIAKEYVDSSPNVAMAYVKHSRIKRRASYIEFLCLKGIKKEILMAIKEAAFLDKEEWFSFIDTADIEKRTKSKPSIIRDAIYRMKEEEWFEIIHSSYSGKRLVKINKENYKL